jgi:hypothetical protein
VKITIDGVEYQGFQRMTPAAEMHSLTVIIWFDGEPEIWNCEDIMGVDALRAYYRKEWGDRVIPYTVLTVINRHFV